MREDPRIPLFKKEENVGKFTTYIAGFMTGIALIFLIISMWVTFSCNQLNSNACSVTIEFSGKTK